MSENAEIAGQVETGQTLVGKLIKFITPEPGDQPRWRIEAYDDEKDRYLIAPADPMQEPASTDRHATQWAKRDKFELV